MSRLTLRLLAAAVTVAALALGPAAQAAPSCLAQSVQAEHDVYGATWGHDLIAFLASHPEVLEEFGFSSFGELAAFAASQDRSSCPPDL